MGHNRAIEMLNSNNNKIKKTNWNERCTHTCYIHEKLCIFVYNGLDSYGCTWIYMFFFKIWIYNVFFGPVFSSYCPVHIFVVDRFDDRPGYDNTCQDMIRCWCLMYYNWLDILYILYISSLFLFMWQCIYLMLLF